MSPSPMSGPSMDPVSGAPARQLVVFLHGVGANGDDLFSLSSQFAKALPDAAFVSPNAPFRFDMAPFGYQWFSLQSFAEEDVEKGARTAAPLLNAFLDGELAKLGLDDSALLLVGFSQGTMMALHVAMRRPKACAGVIGYSGMLIAPGTLEAEIASRPPVLLVHGEIDMVVPAGRMGAATGALHHAGVSVRSHLCHDLGHGIDPEGLTLGIQFAAEVFTPEA